jgi:hypothetical protein
MGVEYKINCKHCLTGDAVESEYLDKSEIRQLARDLVREGSFLFSLIVLEIYGIEFENEAPREWLAPYKAEIDSLRKNLYQAGKG